MLSLIVVGCFGCFRENEVLRSNTTSFERNASKTSCGIHVQQVYWNVTDHVANEYELDTFRGIDRRTKMRSWVCLQYKILVGSARDVLQRTH